MPASAPQAKDEDDPALGGSRAALRDAYRAPEASQVAMLLPQARLPADAAAAARNLARRLTVGLRKRQAGGRAGMIQELLREFSLSSQEGVALMCLAEALLRIPDVETRDALIRDKIGAGDWQAHIGRSASPFVNAAAWGLLIGGRLVSTHGQDGLARALHRLLARGGEPVVRRGVDIAMRLMGRHFVAGETIAQAIADAAPLEARGFRHSYDMLGEAALTDDDARRYLAAYEEAIEAIGSAARGLGIHRGPGISIKLSALHPRYTRAQRERVLAELYPRLLGLARLARHHDIGLNIDAEEAHRLELSLDLLERLCREPALAGWNGIGFVVQAYQKRCLAVTDWLVGLARRSGHRLMVRLVKGAYWDSEIKQAQVAGLEDYPVFTRKAHTDVSYIACARRLLAASDAVFPQFATHNAHTLAVVHQLAGPGFHEGRYEFQCLHGMGETLYEQVVAAPADGGLGRPCRIYAPVGTHDTLLAYLVRRLLENGANTSFVQRVADPRLPVEALVEDPVARVDAAATVEGGIGLRHPLILLPRELYPDRPNSRGLDLDDERCLAAIRRELARESPPWSASPLIAGQAPEAPPAGAMRAATPPARWRAIRNPACRAQLVGMVRDADRDEIARALRAAEAAFPAWEARPAGQRAEILLRAADMLEARMPSLLGPIVREAGKTLSNAIAEVREAVDFLRYYGTEALGSLADPDARARGPVACISPWNFPLAIFTGQVAAALAAGNTVLAKPAEQTSLIAARAVGILQEAGLPPGVLQLLPGRGEDVGAALVADPAIQAVLFTGSTQVARILQGVLAQRLDARGRPVPLVAETGGQNAMIVDSSALLEQVVVDVMSSAFDSAGQRCSALRILCLQRDIAERAIAMLEGAMKELTLGDPERLRVDIGPVIDEDARRALERHVAAMRGRGRRVFRAGRVADPGCPAGEPSGNRGLFVPPTLIEIERIEELEAEVFGPVLHVLRYPRDGLGELLARIGATGYGLTLGVHSRIDETIEAVVARAPVGNIYVNRNMIGAVVGVQPFGGEGLSGTGPKAGGPLYVRRLLSRPPSGPGHLGADPDRPPGGMLATLARWSGEAGRADTSECCARFAAQAPAVAEWILDGPTGERNTWRLVPRTEVMCLAAEDADLLCQFAAVLAVGSRPAWPDTADARALASRLPSELRATIRWLVDWRREGDFTALLHHGSPGELPRVGQELARRPGPIVDLQGLRPGERDIALERLFVERSVSVNTAAAGGNASLMGVG